LRSKDEKLSKKLIIKAMVIASFAGLVVPGFVVLMVFVALYAFADLNIIVRAVLMIIFGLMGLGLGTAIYIKLLPYITPKELKERTKK